MIKLNHYEAHIINEIMSKYNLDVLCDEIEAIFDYTAIEYHTNNRIIRKGNVFTRNKEQNQHLVYDFTLTHNHEGEIQSCLVVDSYGGKLY